MTNLLRFFNLNKNSDLARELAAWDKKQEEFARARAAEAEEEAVERQKQALANMQRQMYQQFQSSVFYSQGGLQSALGSSALQSLGTPNYSGLLGGPAPASPDPHATLTAQLGKLREAEPVKITRRSPDFCQTITAWRGWGIKNEKLQALGQEAAWKPKEAKPAKCTQSKSHRAPSRECNCGYWSFKSLDLLTEALKGYTTSVAVLGQVEIWGRVIDCENGFRSEFAYPKELWLLKQDLEYLSCSYGVPVRSIPIDGKP